MDIQKNDPSNPYSNKPTDAAVISKLYHLSNTRDGINDIEDYFSNEIEEPASLAFKALLNSKFPDSLEREKLSVFFGTLMVRTPSYINHLNLEQSKQINILGIIGADDKEYFRNCYKILFPEIDDVTIENDRQSILYNQFSFNLHRDLILKNAVNFGKKIADLLANMQWSLIKTTADLPFITSDNLINIFRPETQHHKFYQSGLGMHDIRVFIPLSQESGLLLINNKKFKDGSIFNIANPPNGPNGEKVPLKKLIKDLNKTTYIKSYEYIFASSNLDELKRCFNNILINAELIEKYKEIK